MPGDKAHNMRLLSEGTLSVARYNDLPAEYWDNVNTAEPPYDPVEGEAPRLAPEEIDALVAFLETLTDGYHDESSGLPHIH